MTLTLGKIALKTFQNYKRRAQSKINRLKKKGFDVSKYIDFDLKPNFENRKEYNAWKRKVDNFTKRSNKDYQVQKNKKGVEYLGIEKKILESQTKTAIEKAKQKQKELNALPVLDETGKQISTVEEDRKVLKDKELGFIKEPTPIDIDELPSRNVIEKRIEKMNERASDEYFDRRNETMRENWLHLMRISFGEDADNLIDKVEQMNINDFVELFWMFRDFKFEWYDSEKGYLGENNSEQLEELERSVDNYNKNRVDKDLKVFR